MRRHMIRCFVTAVLAAVWLKVPFVWMDLVGFALILSTTFILSVPDLKKAARNDKEAAK